jgi:hypothetical protein
MGGRCCVAALSSTVNRQPKQQGAHAVKNFYSLTDRSIEPSAPAHPSAAGYSGFKRLVDTCLDKIRGGTPAAQAEIEANAGRQSMHTPEQSAPGYGPVAGGSRDTGYALGSRGSGHQEAYRMAPMASDIATGATGRVGGPRGATGAGFTFPGTLPDPRRASFAGGVSAVQTHPRGNSSGSGLTDLSQHNLGPQRPNR